MSSFTTKAQATKAGKAVKAKMIQPKKWKVNVWENMGWYVCLQCGGCTLFIDPPSKFGLSRTTFWAMFNSQRRGDHSGECHWTRTDRIPHTNPNNAVASCMNKVHAYLHRANAEFDNVMAATRKVK